jgi:hypothetical protein
LKPIALRHKHLAEVEVLQGGRVFIEEGGDGGVDGIGMAATVASMVKFMASLSVQAMASYHTKHALTM